MTSSMHSDHPSLSYASDMRTLMENMHALNVHDRQDASISMNSATAKDNDSRAQASRIYKPHSYQTQTSAGENPEVS